MPKQKKYENIKGFSISWYALTMNRLLMTLGPLRGEINCDVCVIGGGFTGTSVALELSQKGLSVVMLEAQELSSSAPGRNGGHLIRGFGKSPQQMISKFGLADAKTLSNVSLEGLGLILARIAKHEIKCDLKFGHLTAALKQRHVAELKEEQAAWAKLGHADFEWLKKPQAQEKVRAEKYIGGLFDPKGAHFHPLNYVLGLAQAAQKAGCKIHDETPALEIIPSNMPQVVTPNGRVKAKFVILAGAVSTKGAESMKKRSLMSMTHMIATAPGGERLRALIPADIAVTEANAVPHYYQLSPDGRLLFGGDAGGTKGADARLRQRMTSLFPQLKTTAIAHCWKAPVEFTASRFPHVGRLAPNILFAHGFGGHGVIAANIMGKILAEAVAGTMGRFDLFARIKPTPLPGGDILKKPLYELGVMWDRLRDLI